MNKRAVAAFLLTTAMSLSGPTPISSFVISSSPFCLRSQLQMGTATYDEVMEKMKAKDKTSIAISKEDLKIIHEDEHILVVDKPAGTLCVPDTEGNPSLSATVFDAYGCESGNADKMVAHRLGMDTSGIVVFARTNRAISKLNSEFRRRKVDRVYEALVCGDVESESGSIDFTLQRDAEALPYMRVSNIDAQIALVEAGLPDKLYKKYVKAPQKCQTEYTVIGKEEIAGQSVTRLSLTSITGRTHQLNVHCAAMGYPIAGDTIYGAGGDATQNGGLEEVGQVSDEVQKTVADDVKRPCVHLKSITLKHPGTKERMTFESASPF